MSKNSQQPALSECMDKLYAVLEDRCSREEANRWAAPWVLDDTLDFDPITWRALGYIFGVALKVSPKEYLHSEKDLRCWIEELEELAHSEGIK